MALKDINKFVHNLSDWYILNQRDLPFRKTDDPYLIWISEIMLQQTQVNTMLSYYERFVSLFPNVFALASASIDAVFKVWQGLGYYRRATHLHETAKIIVNQYDGIFPSDLKNIQSLKGIGPYTAGAIHSIAFNRPTPAVDGNVLRVMSRVLAFGENLSQTKNVRYIESVVEALLVESQPRLFTQALMELGAKICTQKPLCEVCPVNTMCQAYLTNTTCEYPVLLKKPDKQNEIYTVFVASNTRGEFLMRRRPDEGLLANLFELPQYPFANLAEASKAFEKEYGSAVIESRALSEVNHVFTHKRWHMKPYVVTLDQSPKKGMFYLSDTLPGAISKAHLKILKLVK